MGILRGKFNQCDWLNDQDKISLSAELDRIENQLSDGVIYPKLENVLDVFTCLKLFPRIVIVGTDPYPDDRATGIPFAVPDNYKRECPNTLKTLNRVFGFKRGTRSEWVKWMNDKHVLMLNKSLTKIPGRLTFRVWQKFIGAILKVIAKNGASVTFWLMGREAKMLKNFLNEYNCSVICTCHPSMAYCKSVAQNDCFKLIWEQIGSGHLKEGMK